MTAAKLLGRKVAVILVAAGRGERAGGDRPKQYQSLLGKAVLVHTIGRLFQSLSDVEQFVIQPVIRAVDDQLWREASYSLDDAQKSSLSSAVYGGETRQASVYNGLVAVSDYQPDIVMIHDGARPFVTEKMMAALLNALEQGASGAVPALTVTDSMVRVIEDGAMPVDRAGLLSVQTPQAFTYDRICEAHEAAEHDQYTDDASLLQAMGFHTEYVAGAEGNFKITNPEDFERAQRQIMQELSDIRTGTGFDVHRFEDGDHVNLCGVSIPFHQSLKGHSDADVALHALTDAILAALSDGDIGAHFPPSDDEWSGADSSVFLKFAGKRVMERGGAIGHVGVTIVCEAPKIRPHVNTMQQRVAGILDIDIDRVSIQATTTERLGFTGRGEGIAAQAVATVRLPLAGVNP